MSVKPGSGGTGGAPAAPQTGARDARSYRDVLLTSVPPVIPDIELVENVLTDL